MKIVLAAITIFIFAFMPLYALEVLVMPELHALEQTYAHADAIADHIAGTTPAAD